ncbi:MAG: hypothetical protein GX060_04010 [Firmicutes bacterium]|nr:hypothetical protein [Bacillota bacterium]
MRQQELRTYRRRRTTRTSGFHTCGETTGGECQIKRAQRYIMHQEVETFTFRRTDIILTELFDTGNGMLAFGGYLYTDKPLAISFHLQYVINGRSYEYQADYQRPIRVNDWNNIGFHKEICLDDGELVEVAAAEMKIRGEANTFLEFISIDFGPICKEEYIGDNLQESGVKLSI